MKFRTKRVVLSLCSFLITLTSFSQIRLPKLVSDGMVLQRDTKLSIWGWATAGEKVTVKGNKVILSFNNTGSDMVVKGDGPLKQFAIAGADKKFVWAKAVIRNNRVEVWSDDVTDPVAVRYAWADNPDGVNLYNMEDCPPLHSGRTTSNGMSIYRFLRGSTRFKIKFY